MAEEATVKAGDMVRLKSGGPPMTVNRIGNKINNRIVCCIWFDGATRHEAEFEPETLKAVTQGKKVKLSELQAKKRVEPNIR